MVAIFTTNFWPTLLSPGRVTRMGPVSRNGDSPYIEILIDLRYRPEPLLFRSYVKIVGSVISVVLIISFFTAK